MGSSHHEEEDDYMSDALLSRVPDIRPGIVLSRTIARKRKLEEEKDLADEKHKNAGQLRKHLEFKNRNEALSKPVCAENKGFAMMAKMGYKPGMSIGKKGDGLKEPITVDLKNDRTGLGHATHRKEKGELRIKALKIALEAKEKLNGHLKVDYHQRKRDLAAQKKLENDFWKSQKVCYELDSREEIETPAEEYFWPNYAKDLNPEAAEEGDQDDLQEDLDLQEGLELSEKLIILTAYLRESHFYCVWCGAKFDSKTDLAEHCPGDTKDKHDDDDL